VAALVVAWAAWAAEWVLEWAAAVKAAVAALEWVAATAECNKITSSYLVS
jgi:hypothetical protein